MGSCLYYVHVIDMTILHSVTQLHQNRPTLWSVHWNLYNNYYITCTWIQEQSFVCVHQKWYWTYLLGASYVSAGKGPSRVGGYFFFRNLTWNGEPIRLSVDIAILCAILKVVAASAADTERSTLYVNTEEAWVICLVLAQPDHPELPTHIHINNTTAVGIVDNTTKRKCSHLIWDISGFLTKLCRNSSRSTTILERNSWKIILPKHTQDPFTYM